MIQPKTGKLFQNGGAKKMGAINGNTAMESKMPKKGITHKTDSSAPLTCGMWDPEVLANIN